MTGFDVQSLANIYLDKPLKAHTLMQTIARANRVYEGKSNGLIVDYIGVVKALRQALADYTGGVGGTGGNDPTPDKEELTKRIFGIIREIEAFMAQNGYLLQKLVTASAFEKLALVQEGANAMCATDEVRKRFEIQARELFKLFKFISRQELEEQHHRSKNAISAVYDQMQKKRIHADNTTLMVQINQIVSEYLNIEAADPSAEEKRFDISKIDFDRLRKEFERAKNKNLLMKDLYEMVEQRLANMLKNNPLRINYYERYQKIVDEYNQDNQKDEIAIIFENLMKLVNDLDQEERRYVREGFSSDEELAIYDLITKDTLTQEETNKVKALAKTMLAKVKSRIQQLHQWTDKEETRAIIDTMIRDILYMELPASYSDEAIVEYREQIYDYVLKAYPAA